MILSELLHSLSEVFGPIEKIIKHFSFPNAVNHFSFQRKMEKYRRSPWKCMFVNYYLTFHYSKSPSSFIISTLRRESGNKKICIRWKRCGFSRFRRFYFSRLYFQDKRTIHFVYWRIISKLFPRFMRTRLMRDKTENEKWG